MTFSANALRLLHSASNSHVTTSEDKQGADGSAAAAAGWGVIFETVAADKAGAALQSLRSDVLHEPLPDRIAELLRQLDQQLRQLDQDTGST